MSHQLLNLKNTKIIVIGDLMLDRYWHGDVSRISPEAPVPVVLLDENAAEDKVGGAGNVAINIAALGGNVKIFSYAGEDQAANALQELLTKANIEHDLQKLKDLPTITKLRVTSHYQQLIRLDVEKPVCNLAIEVKAAQAKLVEHFQAEIDSADVVVLSDYAKGVLFDPQPYIQLAINKGVKVIVDPKSKDFSLYSGATVITPNLKEFQAVVGECKNKEEMIAKGKNLVGQHAIENLVVTCGADGAWVIPQEGEALHIPAKGAEVYDVTGAGDTVVAVIAAALALDLPLNSAVHLAVIAAGVAVSKVGTATVSLQELHQACTRYGEELKTGIVTEQELSQIIKSAQLAGEKVAFVNGCYDVLHHGHINYLKQAKSLGDRLVVGVNSDESVAELKGPSRPVNKLQHRMEVLAELKAVDWVVPFAESTPGRLVNALQPDILVKTDECFTTVKDIPPNEGVESVLARGGKVCFVSRTAGISSTEILSS